MCGRKLTLFRTFTVTRLFGFVGSVPGRYAVKSCGFFDAVFQANSNSVTGPGFGPGTAAGGVFFVGGGKAAAFFSAGPVAAARFLNNRLIMMLLCFRCPEPNPTAKTRAGRLTPPPPGFYAFARWSLYVWNCPRLRGVQCGLLRRDTLRLLRFLYVPS